MFDSILLERLTTEVGETVPMIVRVDSIVYFSWLDATITKVSLSNGEHFPVEGNYRELMGITGQSWTE